MKLLTIAIAAGLLGCATPTPVPDPPPQPTPDDPFAGAVVDCSLPEVVGQLPSATGPVAFCLVGTTASSCLAKLVTGGTLRVDTVACEVRQQGVDSNRRVLAGEGWSNDTATDAACRAWLEQERIGFRGVRP